MRAQRRGYSKSREVLKKTEANKFVRPRSLKIQLGHADKPGEFINKKTENVISAVSRAKKWSTGSTTMRRLGRIATENTPRHEH